MGPTHHAADPRAESEMGEGENTGVWVVSGMKLCFVNPHWAPAGWVNSTFHAPIYSMRDWMGRLLELVLPN
jgi:hypothetical protein